MDRDAWLLSLAPGCRAFLESTCAAVKSRLVIIEEAEPQGFVAAGLRFNPAGKCDDGEQVWSLVPVVWGAS